MYRTVAGIDTDSAAPGYKRILVQPRPDDRLTCAKGTYRSLYGEIVCDWPRDENGLTVEARIRPNTTATVTLPGGGTDRWLESGAPLAEAEGVAVLLSDGDRTVLEAVSGCYRFFLSIP